MQSTICALASGQGGAVALVRLSGPDALVLTHTLTGNTVLLEPRRQTFCPLYDGKHILDKALVTYFKAPHSFTGEDVVEFALHGSPYIIGRTLELLCKAGAVPAKRGEFSQRAFLNGKMDLIEAQGLCDVIAAGNKAAHRLAMSSLDGQLSARLTQIKTHLTELLAQIEVRLDDVDEEMTPLPAAFVTQELDAVLSHLKALTDTFSVGRLIKDGLKVAIVGAPNSGKSSLLNALVGFERAIVTDVCGTTRDTVEETLELNGQKIILTDTAGIRAHALDMAEEEGMRRSKRAMEKADVILLVLDASRAVNDEEKQLWADIQKEHKRTLLVLNKCDKGPVISPALPAAAGYAQFTVSCKKGDGLDALKTALTAPLNEVPPDGLLLSNLRHYEQVLRAQTELESAQLQLAKNAGGEIYAEHIRGALMHLKDLTGEVTPDDILGVIFSKFCMGK